MQGIKSFIPTEIKIEYLNLLLKVGFHTLDFGSFVSPTAIPQMADTKEVLAGLDLSQSETKLLAIVANTRGAEEACSHDEISYLGYPFSISETFQDRNTNTNIEQSVRTVDEIHSLCHHSNKEVVVYLSMGFGNPYGDPWSYEILENWAAKLIKSGIKIISVADTVGSATELQVSEILPKLISKFRNTEIGVHLHSTAAKSDSKIEAIYQSGCTRIDSSLKGFGGCPMAEDQLTGNIATEKVITLLQEKNEDLGLDLNCWQKAMAFSTKVFG